MYFNATKLILFSIFVTSLVASPIESQERTSDYVEHFRETSKNGGTLIYYGPANSTEVEESNAQSLQERTSCGTSSTTPTCGDDHQARNKVCNDLLDELYNDATVKVHESPRQICYLGNSGSNEYCCVSWDKTVKTLTKGDLAPFASKIIADCDSNGISGKTSGIHIVSASKRLGNKCNSVCVSNRGTHC